jgi:hypothetical protein
MADTAWIDVTFPLLPRITMVLVNGTYLLPCKDCTARGAYNLSIHPEEREGVPHIRISESHYADCDEFQRRIHKLEEEFGTLDRRTKPML